jgi:N-acetylglucosaminyl-diphospho-decaprenol L-rhamnosyltransferase
VSAPRLESLTIVVLNWNTPHYTVRCVEALAEDGVSLQRIVIVDNGSTDDSPERLAREVPACRLVRVNENVGPAAANNIGARALAGENYLFMNNDAFVAKPGSVAALLSVLDDESIGIVVPRLLNEDRTLQPSVVPFQGPASALVRATGLSRFVPDRLQPRWSTHWSHDASREIESATGTVVLVRGRLFDELGGYDPGRRMYAEELDLCYRAHRLGRKVWFTTEAEFVHLGGGSTRSRWDTPTRMEMIARSEAEVIRSQLSRPSAFVTILFTVLGLAARWAYYRLRGNGEAAAATRAGIRGYLGRG